MSDRIAAAEYKGSIEYRQMPGNDNRTVALGLDASIVGGIDC
jgi:hypothetical protein